ncbi:MAG: hypothetical protein WAN60_12030 [Candidatus Sulfotelmatobacter sp.]
MGKQSEETSLDHDHAHSFVVVVTVDEAKGHALKDDGECVAAGPRVELAVEISTEDKLFTKAGRGSESEPCDKLEPVWGVKLTVLPLLSPRR